MTRFEMCMAALQRPSNFGQLPTDRQWEIDKALGILDWAGIDLDEARKVVEAKDVTAAAQRFKMNLTELGQVVRAHDSRVK
jgi:hypothetical protein